MLSITVPHVLLHIIGKDKGSSVGIDSTINYSRETHSDSQDGSMCPFVFGYRKGMHRVCAPALHDRCTAASNPYPNEVSATGN
jgi:hypothetical protein